MEYKLWYNNSDKYLNLLNGIYNDPPDDNPPIIIIEYPTFSNSVYIPMPYVLNEINISNKTIINPSPEERRQLIDICKLSIIK